MISYAIRVGQWFAIWVLVTFMIVGSITSVTWAQLALAKKYWAVEVIRSEN